MVLPCNAPRIAHLLSLPQLQALSDGYQLTEVDPLLKLTLPNLNTTFAGMGPCPTEPLIISNATEDSAFAPAPAPARANVTSPNGAFAGPMPGFPAAVAAAAGAVVLSMLL